MTTRLYCFISLLPFITTTCIFAQTDTNIRPLFTQFQEGYRLRDTAKVFKFTKELFTQDILIIGTGNNENAEGLVSARQLILNDWAYWLNLRIDTSKLIIHMHQGNADFMVPGIAFIVFPSKDAAYDYAYNRLKQLTDNLTGSKSKVLSYSRESSDLINEIEKGSLEFKYSIRITGSIRYSNDKWKFSQLVYSFPYPMNRQ